MSLVITPFCLIEFPEECKVVAVIAVGRSLHSCFHMYNGSLVPDVMHDILEGALQYEVKLMLQFMVDTERYFTLDELNTRLEHMELGYMECKDRPTVITATTLYSSGNSLKQKGMMTRYNIDELYFICIFFGLFNCSCTDVAPWPDSSGTGWGSCS